jgi:hypothetical protein
MANPGNEKRYTVHCAGAITKLLRKLQRQASRKGKGKAMSSAFERIVHQLEIEPWTAGEPVYNLPSLRMQIRNIAVPPLVVHFGVCEDWPMVFIQGVKSL